MKTYFTKSFIFILFVLVFIPSISLAAEISFKTEKDVFSLNEDFLVEVFLDTKNDKINAVEGNIVFPDSFLELKEIRDGNSSINFWVEKPHITKNGEVLFSGITAGGFSGPKIFLFSLVFHASNTGNGVINLNDIKVLKNDGLGTKISTNLLKPLDFSIVKELKDSEPADLKINDIIAPEVFYPIISNDSTIFDGKNFVAFSTVDKNSGIDHYEVRESFWGFGGDYNTVESPYILKDQTLKDKVYIKAVDKLKNERIVKIGPQNKIAFLEKFLILGIILVICIFLYKKIGLKFTR
ncbi:MAG: hypothetical protein NTZ44_00245 [Candidatus Nomurabacteria bacterium]|nr:hypothetical protein [Candidatus Nomurabacteria bacterium]